MITGPLIREARLRAGLSQSQLGARLDLHPTVISRWERGAVTPSMETLRKVVRACGLELTYGLAEADPNGHDSALIERALAMTPAERLRQGAAEYNAIERMAAHARAPRD